MHIFTITLFGLEQKFRYAHKRVTAFLATTPSVLRLSRLRLRVRPSATPPPRKPLYLPKSPPCRFGAVRAVACTGTVAGSTDEATPLF